MCYLHRCQSNDASDNNFHALLHVQTLNDENREDSEYPIGEGVQSGNDKGEVHHQGW